MPNINFSIKSVVIYLCTNFSKWGIAGKPNNLVLAYAQCLSFELYKLLFLIQNQTPQKGDLIIILTILQHLSNIESKLNAKLEETATKST